MGAFLMPSLGADMEGGAVVEWRVPPGDDVHRGDIVAVVDTEKSTIEVEVFETASSPSSSSQRDRRCPSAPRWPVWGPRGRADRRAPRGP